MAIQNRRGYEADFDPAKMLPGEWAVSLDTKYVRMCFAPGVCLRMATYEGFEQDMEEVRRILAECRDIQIAVELIRDNVADAELVIEDYVSQAKQYRDEAEQFKNEAFATTPEGYADLVQNVAENTVKIDTIIEKAELNIKNTATGENIHLTDSADAKTVAFGLYGKAEQKQYSGKNLAKLEIGSVSMTTGDEIVSTNRVRTQFIPITQNVWYIATNAGLSIANGVLYDANKKYIKNGVYPDPITGAFKTEVENVAYVRFIYRLPDNSDISNADDYAYQFEVGTVQTPYEPFVGNAPSPSPDYPQEIEIAGAGGSVDVKTCGKNLFNGNQNKGQYRNGVWEVLNTRLSTELLKISSRTITFSLNSETMNMSFINLNYFDKNKNWLGNRVTLGLDTFSNTLRDVTATFPDNAVYVSITCRGYGDDKQYSDISALSLVDEMLQIEESGTATQYEPYKETTATITTPDGLAGIPVASGGNYTDEKGQQWVCDEVVKYADGTGKRIKRIGIAESYNGESITTIYISTTGQLTIGAKVLYILPEPVITDLPYEEIAEIEKLHTFYPMTNISNYSYCGMEVTYLADSKNYIDNQLAIQAQAQEDALATMLLLLPEETQAAMIENDTNNLLAESEE